MDNKNTNKVTQFEAKSQAKAKSREKAIVAVSAVFVLAALTLTGMYMNNQSQDNTILEDSTGLQGDGTNMMQSPELTDIQDLQIVDSTTVENPGRTGNQDTEGDGETQSEKKPATKSSNTLKKTEGEESTEPITEDVMSGTVENPMFSFSGMNMLWPVAIDSEILIPYSMDKAVYFETLDQYKYNPAMIIAAIEGTPVCAVSAGRVTDKYWDYETGWTYEMDLGGGFKAYYGQLDNMTKEVDTYVAEGDILGYVTTPTIYYTEEGCNLYFAMTKDDQPVYPMDYIGE